MTVPASDGDDPSRAPVRQRPSPDFLLDPRQHVGVFGLLSGATHTVAGLVLRVLGKPELGLLVMALVSQLPSSPTPDCCSTGADCKGAAVAGPVLEPYCVGTRSLRCSFARQQD